MYGFTTTLTGTSFAQAHAKTIAILKAEGCGVLSDIGQPDTQCVSWLRCRVRSLRG